MPRKYITKINAARASLVYSVDATFTNSSVILSTTLGICKSKKSSIPKESIIIGSHKKPRISKIDTNRLWNVKTEFNVWSWHHRPHTFMFRCCNQFMQKARCISIRCIQLPNPALVNLILELVYCTLSDTAQAWM